MEFEIRFESNALYDIEEAIEYYESQQKGLGVRFKNSLELSISYIEKIPKAFSFYKNKVRKIPLEKFPYMIFYKIYTDKVIIIAVFNTYQNPAKKP